MQLQQQEHYDIIIANSIGQWSVQSCKSIRKSQLEFSSVCIEMINVDAFDQLRLTFYLNPDFPVSIEELEKFLEYETRNYFYFLCHVEAFE